MTLRRNALFSIFEVIFSGLGLFLIYRAVLMELGLSLLGVWSLVLATTAFGRMADVGIASGLARFIASALAAGSSTRAVLYMRTGVIAVAIIMGIATLLLWQPFSWGLKLALEGDELLLARDLLPWALFTFWCLSLRAAFDACLVGSHRADLKSLATIAGMALQIAMSLSLVKDFGLFGLAWAQAAQSVLSIVLLAGAVRWLPTLRDAVPKGWFSSAMLREMLGFGLKLQLGTIANLLFEPASKVVLGAIGGTAMLGLFEMAYRMVYQARSVAIMAQSTILPRMVELLHRDPDGLAAFLCRTSRISALASLVIMLVTMALSPLVGLVWMSRIDKVFLQITALLSVSWGMNIIAAPAYYLGIAQGRVAANVAGQVLAGLLAPALAWFLGHQFGALAGVWGIVIGRLIADLLPMLFNRPAASPRTAVIFQSETYVATFILSVAAVLLASFAGQFAIFSF